MDAIDPVLEFQHDHAELNQLVRDLGALVRGATPATQTELVAQLGELREHLFLHFAREEEGLFPHVAAALPALADEVATMVTAHDAICGAVARMHHLTSTGALEQLPALYDRFELSYTLHARSERGFLQDIGERLSPTQRAELLVLVRGL